MLMTTAQSWWQRKYVEGYAIHFCTPQRSNSRQGLNFPCSILSMLQLSDGGAKTNVGREGEHAHKTKHVRVCSSRLGACACRVTEDLAGVIDHLVCLISAGGNSSCVATAYP